MEKTTIEIKKIKNAEVSCESDVVICEYPLTIYINEEEFITLLCTPKDLKELSYGLLYSEGFIQRKGDVTEFFMNQNKGTVHVRLSKEIDLIKKLHGKRVRTTGCGKGSIFYHTIDSVMSRKIESTFKISYEQIFDLSNALNRTSELFLETGGVHTSLLANQTGVITYYEDVGRHNTVDKLIGYALLNELNLSETAIVTSGRISSEMLLKALKARIPMVISRSAPTDLAVKLACEYNLSLIGFVRGKRLNIYHDSDRIKFESSESE